MEITKFGHSCILLNDETTKIIFDPGMYSEIPEIHVDAIIITHVHSDHYYMENLEKLFKNNIPRIITNTQVADELKKHGMHAEVIEHGQSTRVSDFLISAHGNDHAIIHPDMPKFQNTGYLINNSIFHPGDALFLPPQPVEILFLPIVAPWSKVSETLDYLTAVKARINFPIHDAFLKFNGNFYKLSKQWCEKNGTEFIEPELNKIYGY